MSTNWTKVICGSGGGALNDETWASFGVQVASTGWQILTALAVGLLAILKLVMDKEDVLDLFRKNKRGMRAKADEAFAVLVAAVKDCPPDRSILRSSAGVLGEET